MVTLTEQRVPTGSSLLDAFLEGGYEQDAVTTIYGPAGAGKTTLALLAAIATAERGKKTIFVDTEGGFSVARLKQLAKNYKPILEKIIFLNPTTFQQQKRSIERLKSLVNQKIGLIVVDTISMLYRLERKIGNSSGNFNRELGLQVAGLTEIARKKKIPVLLTNQVYSTFEREERLEQPLAWHGNHASGRRMAMVGGDILKYGSKCLIELQIGHGGLRKAILRKHRSIAGERELLFEIVPEGLKAAVDKIIPQQSLRG
ncbi:MAG: DNA repair and recombination protein RadB [Candidatus Woesearchaeota archaeon]